MDLVSNSETARLCSSEHNEPIPGASVLRDGSNRFLGGVR